MRKPKPGLAELQAAAHLYTTKVLSSVDFHLGGLDEDAFAKAMTVITQQIIAAWAAGYAEGAKR